jgi:hypothetical protein
MSTAVPAPSVLVAGLVDDAAVFPPGNAPMPEAVDAHRRHRAVRHRDDQIGCWQHGFLNILLATHAARTGGDVVAVLDERDPAALVGLAGGISHTAARATRRLFAGYGSCSVPEPVADLTELGLL